MEETPVMTESKTKLILAPIVSEKTVNLGRQNRYAFWVETKATKPEIVQAFKELFKVKVVKVNLVTSPGKKKRFRGIWGKRKERKKAIITLSEGQKLALFEEPKK